jgi:hypothetical protein
MGSRSSSASIGNGMKHRGSIPGWRWEGIFPYATASRPPVGPTQLHLKSVPGALSLGVSTRRMKLTTPFDLVPTLRMRGAIPPFHQYASTWRGTWLSTGTTLPLPVVDTRLISRYICVRWMFSDEPVTKLNEVSR